MCRFTCKINVKIFFLSFMEEKGKGEGKEIGKRRERGSLGGERFLVLQGKQKVEGGLQDGLERDL